MRIRFRSTLSRITTVVFRLIVIIMLGAGTGLIPANASPSSAPATAPATCGAGCSVTIDALDFASSTPLANFSYIINVDNTKLPSDPLALNSESFSPIVKNGNQDHMTVTLPDGRYLVSVRSLDHKMWGAYFTLPNDADNNGNLTVHISLTEQSADHPLPLGKIRVFVFNDNAWTNGAPDTEEAGLGGFKVGLEEETQSAVTVDYLNQPLCGGVCTTSNAAATRGFVEINNLGPAGYFINVQPPDSCDPNDPNATSGPGHWYQTTTIDGGVDLYAPTEEGADGTGAPGEQLWEPPNIRTAYWFGFVCAPKDFANPGTGEIVGQARNWVEWAPYTTGTFNDPVENPFVALSDASTDQTIFVGRGDAAGNFDIQGVPAGDYNLAIWDEQLNYIMRFKPVHIDAGATVDVNDLGNDGVSGIGVSRWFGWLDGHVYKDLNNNGQYDEGIDLPIPNTDMDQRWRDGSIKDATFTDANGYYQYPMAEGGALGRWIINEQGFARFSAFPGASIHDEHTGAVIPSCVAGSPANPCVPNSQGGGLLMNQLLSEGHRATVDWGKVDYPAGTPGQIVGITYFATTRNEFEAYKQAHEDYEPAVPDVTVYLETPGPDGIPNTADDVVVNKYVTDHWQQPNASQDPQDNGQGGPNSFTQNCAPIRDFSGADITSQFNPDLGPNCLEVPLNGIQTKEGAFDGGYAFADYCPNGYDMAADNGTCNGGGDPVPLVAGTYITHYINPTDPTDTRDCNAGTVPGDLNATTAKGTIPGGGTGCLYRVVKEEDVNVDLGNNFTPAIPPPACIGDLHIIDQSTLTPRSIYYTGDQTLRTDTGDTTSGSATVADTSVTSADVGRFLMGSGIPVGAKIVSVVDGVSFTMDAPATATATGVALTVSGSPWEPLCDKKLVVLQNLQNANADFNLMTNFRTDPNGEAAPFNYPIDPTALTGDVAEPARFVGQVFNDIYFERNQMSNWYGEPRPISGIPIGIYARVDIANNNCGGGVTTCITGKEGGTGPTVTYDPNNWRLLTTVMTSPDGSFEALVPSTETLNCPIPQGPCPGMYLITVNDPGSKTHPNPNYDPVVLTATTPATAWPGLTNEFLDLPLDPISGTACEDPAVPARPNLLQVSTPVVSGNGSAASRQITIFADFIGTTGAATNATGVRATLTDWQSGQATTLTRGNGGIVSWVPGSSSTPDTIVIQVPAVSSTFAPGPKQLTITTANVNGGVSSVNGITIHVLGDGTVSRTDTGFINNGTLVSDTSVVAGDIGRSVSGTGIPAGTTISGPVVPGFSFVMNNAATLTGPRSLTITKTDSGVSITFGSNTASDPSIVAADNGRTVTISGTGGVSNRTITSVNTVAHTFTFSGAVSTATGSGRTATITRTDTAVTNDGTLVIDSSITAGDVGASVSAAGIPSGSTILSVSLAGPSAVHYFVMNNKATQTGTRTLTITSSLYPAYNPPVANVAPPPPLGSGNIQAAIDSAAPGSLIVLSPGVYNENLLMWKPVKLQGLGPGGIIGAHELQARDPEDPRFNIKGSVIDGRFFQQNFTGFDAEVAAHAPYVLPPFTSGPASTVLRGADITVVAQSTSAYDIPSGPAGVLSTARIDGLGLMTGHGDGAGGIQLQASVNNLQITNNVLENNGGVFAGGIGLGQPYVHGSHNYNVRMDRNSLIGNGGLTTSGGLGIFYGSDGYEVANSVICSNFSVEYGAGVSHIGLSAGGSIHDNQIYYNDAVDSGGGIAIESELPPGGGLGDGSGAVNIDRNLIQSNVSDLDDGGGIFLLNALDQPVNIRNNMIVNNVAADLGGAIMLDDSSKVSIINNTIANNATTASSESSCSGSPACAHGAGLTSEANEPAWQSDPRNTAPYDFSNPVALFNNIFWNNDAMYLDQFSPGATLLDAGFINFEVHGTTNNADTFTPRYSDLTNGLILSPNGTLNPLPGGQGNTSGDPLFVAPFVNELAIAGSRLDPQQASVTITGQDPPVGLTGDYHLTPPATNAAATASFVIDRGAGFSNFGPSLTTPNASSILAPCSGTTAQSFPADFDRLWRPVNNQATGRGQTRWDVGADEVQRANNAGQITPTWSCVGTIAPVTP